jgi:hypothetical protein
MPTQLAPTQRPDSEIGKILDEPHYLIALEGPFPSEPIQPTDPEDPPTELVGSYLMG